ncbi:NAD-dependent epimerase/dehydratase family protein [Flaviflexus ciconiae]|uniref:NAD-dependent epimerase/dehydratase family protein n=1 Tax=Flaviflexus ciconiae TaxID=2496867 RepID=A0A3S9PWR8_9ACTO|nr:NAD-dependent epimerase/dehydratase family protein [Flaviflexus ciconiae]AZQ76778.1 NAD-dependent epimerase/dehydratase family protein [Flaviflexus ciconiae]
MNPGVWLGVVVAGIMSALSPFLVKPVLVRAGIVDFPNERSSHTVPTIRGGGVAPLLGFIVGGPLVLLAVDGEGRAQLTVALAAALIIALLGLVEDYRGLPITIRAGTQLIVGGGLAIFASPNIEYGLSWLPILIVGFAANVNFTNFMDGINGISSLHGLVAGVSFAVIGAISEVMEVTVLGLLTAVTFFPFLPWNLARGKLFLGDVGSYLLGAILGATIIVAMGNGIPLVAALAPLTIYWADAVSVIFRRLFRGEPVFKPHRTHAYQRLTLTGLSHVEVAVIVAAFTAASGSVGGLTASSRIGWLAGAVLLLAISIFYLLLPRLRGDEFPSQRLSSLKDIPMPKVLMGESSWNPSVWVVVGASGFVGGALVRYLEEQGEEVRCVSAPRLRLDPRINDGFEVLQEASISELVNNLSDEFRGADVVVNAAGMATPDGGHSAEIYGANSLLPVVVANAAMKAGVGRLIHLSSAAVQGNKATLDESLLVKPFSPYSRSKALGERAVLAFQNMSTQRDERLGIISIRATSVQGQGRPTTERLRRLASSRFSSVASPGNQPSIVSSVNGLARYVRQVGRHCGELPVIALQPWEGLSVMDVLQLVSGRPPVLLPRALCRGFIKFTNGVGIVAPGFLGLSRRLEVMWFGQKQVLDGFLHPKVPDTQLIKAVLFAEDSV